MDTKRRTVKAELKPYQLGRRLGSGLKFQTYYSDTDNTIQDLTVYDIASIVNVNHFNKPIYRPLSSLTIPITHNGETFVPIRFIAAMMFERMKNLDKVSLIDGEFKYGDTLLIKDFDVTKLPYRVIQWLIAHNFHIDEPQGAWISVDELDVNPYE